MADDISVKFGGDSSGIRAAAAQAKAAVQDQAQAARVANAEVAASFQLLAAELRETREAMQAQATAAAVTATATARIAAVSREATDWQTDLKASLEATALGYVAVKVAAADYAIVAAELNAMRGVGIGATDSIAQMATTAASAASAVRSYYTEVAYAARESRLFAQANDGVRASIGQAILGLETYIERLKIAGTDTARNELAAIAAAGGLERFTQALQATDQGAKSVLVGFTAELMKIPGITREAASGIEVMLATVPNYSIDTNTILVNLIQSISKTGDEAVANAQKISAAFKDDKNGGKILGNLTGDLKNLEDIQVLATRIGASLTPSQASAYYDTIITKLRQQSALQQTIVDQDNAALARLPLIGGAVGVIYEMWSKAALTQREYAANILTATLNLEAHRNAQDAILRAQAQQVEYQKLLNVETSQTTRLEQAESNIATLRARQRRTDASGNAIGASSSERDLMIRTIYGEAANQGAEGQEAVANVIRNRVDSGYRNAQTYTDVIKAPRQFSVWNEGDRAGDMARNLSADSDAYKRIGEIADRVMSGQSTDPTKGATSYYNPNVASPAWGRDLSNVTTIGDHRFGNTPESPPVASAADGETINQRLREQHDLRRQINEAQRGGTEADVASFEIAQKGLTAARDAVAEAQKLVEAREKGAAAAAEGSPAARLAAERALVDARQALRDKEAAQEKSANALQIAGMDAASPERLKIVNDRVSKEQEIYERGSAEWNRLEVEKLNNTRTYELAASRQRTSAVSLQTSGMETASAERLRILNESLTREQALYAQGSAEWNQREQQKAANTRAYEQAVAQEKDATEDASYRRARARLDERLADVKDEARTHRISGEERLQITNQITDEILALERQHQQAKALIWSGDPAKYRATQAQLVQIDLDAAQRRQRARSEALKVEYQETAATYRQIGSTLTSNVFSVIQGQASVKQALVNTAMSLIQSYAQAKVRMIADSLAGATAHQAAEAAKTAGTVAGVTARTSAESAGAATSLATQAGAMLKSIAASAAEGFAGIFGFLSPIMGPAAIGPAAAGQATIAAAAAGVASYAVGSWSLPGDMTANVHKGEMIVPAAATPWAQALMANAASGGGGGGGGGDTHLHVHAMDAGSVARFFQKHGDGIARMVSGRQNANPSLRPGY